MTKKLDLTDAKMLWPWFMKTIFRGRHLILSHKGKDVAAIIPVKDLRRLESYELEELERSDLPESLKDMVRKLNIED